MTVFEELQIDIEVLKTLQEQVAAISKKIDERVSMLSKLYGIKDGTFK